MGHPLHPGPEMCRPCGTRAAATRLGKSLFALHPGLTPPGSNHPAAARLDWPCSAESDATSPNATTVPSRRDSCRRYAARKIWFALHPGLTPRAQTIPPRRG